MSRRALLRELVAVSTALAGAAIPGKPAFSSLRSGAAANSGDNPVLQWDNAALQAIRDTKPGPPMVARALAIVHTCIYDAWAAYDAVAVGTRFGGEMRRPVSDRTLDTKVEALSYAAHRALSDLFPSQASLFDNLMASLGYDPSRRSAGVTTPSGLGTLCALAVTDFRHGDGANQMGDLHPGAYTDYTDYTPVNDVDQIADPNHWQPLRISDGQGGTVVPAYIGPHWGMVTPFALTSGAQFRPADGPEVYPSDAYRAQAQQILDYSANLGDEEKTIAEYWADGPNSELPPGHWCLFGQFVSRRDGNGLDTDVKLFFALSNALMDAGIAVWDAKRFWDSVRPITAVHYLFGGQQARAWAGPYQGTRTINAEGWQPYQAKTVVTPPFPEYVSGHSAFSAAGAEVLRRFTGSDAFGASYTRAAGTSLFEPGVVPASDLTLSWDTFSEAAGQAGLSRRYGGIHFERGDLAGRTMGRLVGAKAWEKAQSFIDGSAARARNALAAAPV